MQLKIYVLPIKNVEPAEEELNRFLRGNRILAVTNEKDGVRERRGQAWTLDN